MTMLLALSEVDGTSRHLVGGKAANLGELRRVEGVRVPDGVCITTEAFARAVEDAAIGERLELASDPVRAAEIRARIEAVAIPSDLRAEVARAVAQLGDGGAFAVRSSATAEDLPTASFAGQHDTYLNVVGVDEILRHVTRCWASLFSERAVRYRVENGFDHRRVRIAVIVQKMVAARASGVLFTADPLTSNRTVSAIEAVAGLGEALVAGHVTPDRYQVRDGAVIAAHGQVLSREQILQLAQLGRTIERHFGQPQDIEWCLDRDGGFQVVQSRPITTLYPIPPAPDADNRVYVSVGHQQMMTDAMRPLGLSMFQLTATGPMLAAGGRLFVDTTRALASPATRQNLLDLLGHSHPLVRDALVMLLERGDFIREVPADPAQPMGIRASKGQSAAEIAAPVEHDVDLVASLVDAYERALAALKARIASVSGPAIFDLIRDDIAQLKALMREPRNVAAILAGINASAWLDDHLHAWLGERNIAGVLAQGVAGNVTSDMGLALLEVADAIRPHAAVVAYLQSTTDPHFLDALPALDGGPAARAAIDSFLDRFGMRCPGEIDITRTRWSEHPLALVPLILGNVRNFAPGAAREKVERGREQSLRKEREILERVAQLPDGATKAADAARMIAIVRAFMGFREYPKYAIVCRFFVYKQALLAEAAALVRANVIADAHDIYMLTFDELHEVVRTHQLDRALIARRRDEQRTFERLSPPRVITSDGEIITGSYQRHDVPAGALVGVPVSSGVVEGRARVLLTMDAATLEPGDILVTRYTDPSWTPLFVSIAGLVTEVGGLMTHGAVIAREYGLPAIVGVEHATALIRDGQRIRVSGSDGYIELL